MEEITPDISYHGPVVVFDLDDTLYKERDYERSGFRAVADELGRRYGLPASDLRMVADSALHMKLNAFDALFGYLDALEADIRENPADLLPVYRGHEPEISLPEESRALLEALRGRGIRMGLLTDGRSKGQRAKIRALGIEEYFHPADVVISEEIGADKLSAEGFARIVRHYPEASAFIYVGDNPAKDFISPNSLGWVTVCLLDAAGDNVHRQEFGSDPAAQPSHTVSSISELLNIL